MKLGVLPGPISFNNQTYTVTATGAILDSSGANTGYYTDDTGTIYAPGGGAVGAVLGTTAIANNASPPPGGVRNSL